MTLPACLNISVECGLVPFALGIVVALERQACAPCGEIHDVLCLRMGLLFVGANIEGAINCTADDTDDEH